MAILRENVLCSPVLQQGGRHNSENGYCFMGFVMEPDRLDRARVCVCVSADWKGNIQSEAEGTVAVVDTEKKMKICIYSLWYYL